MHTNRFNGFAMIHKALRSMLYDCAIDLQQADYADAAAMAPVLQKLENIVGVYDDHADHEDNHILSIAADVHPALAVAFEEEHVVDRQLGENLRNAINSYKSAAEASDRMRTGHHIFYAFNSFIAFNLSHMNKEENELNEVLWAILTDGDIQALNAKISGCIPIEQAMKNYTWMIRACNDNELISFIRAIAASAPRAILNAVLGIAQKELPAARWKAIQLATDIESPEQL